LASRLRPAAHGGVVGHTIFGQQRFQQLFRLTQTDPHRLADDGESPQRFFVDNRRLLQAFLKFVAFRFEASDFPTQIGDLPIAFRQAFLHFVRMIVNGLPAASLGLGLFADRPVVSTKNCARIANPRANW